jgi:hypothetical protein
VRNGPLLPIGSPNFVLIRHNIEREVLKEPDSQGNVEVEIEIVKWYSLYMHMQRMDHNLVEPEPVEVPPIEGQPEEGEETEEGEEAPEETPPPEEQAVEEPTVPERPIPEWFKRLVWLARRAKQPVPLQNHEDYIMETVQAEPQQFHDHAIGLLRLQERTQAFQCVEDGNPYAWLSPTEFVEEGRTGIGVAAGDIIGYVGEYGEYTGGNIVRRGTLHFQIFSTTPIFDDTRFGEDVWQRVQADLSGTNLVSASSIVLPIRGITDEEQVLEAQLDLTRGRSATPSEIAEFFRSGNIDVRRGFRKMIAQHRSEWDIDTDDSLTANVPLLWPWQTERDYLIWRAHHIGFKWLTPDTRYLLEMTEGAAPIYTYHPFYLLGWWALNYGRAMQTATYTGLEGEDLTNALLAETDEEDQHQGEEQEVAHVSLEDMQDFRIRYDDLALEEQGEWSFDVNFIDPFERQE